ncbi:MAG TPA: hypothetical protein VGD60_12235 [Candidatus Acidoferrales bacterium]
MASPGLALSGFANLDQEVAPEYPNGFTAAPGSANRSAAATEIQPLPIAIPHDTVTLSSSAAPRATYQESGTNPAAAPLSAPAFYPPGRASRATATAAVPATESPANSQSTAAKHGESTALSETQTLPKPAPAPHETDASQNDPYRASTQTTQQSLLQLDRTLQQIGINPQRTSLIRRVALVRLANDPPALGQYFGASPSVTAPASSASTKTESTQQPTQRPASPDAASTESATETSHQTFGTNGKRLNVSA